MPAKFNLLLLLFYKADYLVDSRVSHGFMDLDQARHRKLPIADESASAGTVLYLPQVHHCPSSDWHLL